MRIRVNLTHLYPCPRSKNGRKRGKKGSRHRCLSRSTAGSPWWSCSFCLRQKRTHPQSETPSNMRRAVGNKAQDYRIAVFWSTHFTYVRYFLCLDSMQLDGNRSPSYFRGDERYSAFVVPIPMTMNLRSRLS